MFLEIRGIRKSFGEGDSLVEVLKGIDLSVEKGEFCVLLGPSGSGKSTLLNIIGGIDRADEGSITIAGEKTEDMDEKRLTAYRRKHLGYIFQMYNLIPNLTVRENIEVGAYLSEHPLDVDELMETLGLTAHGKKLPNQLSGGQQQRVGVARALVVDPEIIFADEPTGNLDSNTSREVMELMQQVVHEKQQTLVMVTHDNHLASFADRIFHIIDGKIVRIDDMTGKSKEEREKEEKKREEEASI